MRNERSQQILNTLCISVKCMTIYSPATKQYSLEFRKNYEVPQVPGFTALVFQLAHRCKILCYIAKGLGLHAIISSIKKYINPIPSHLDFVHPGSPVILNKGAYTGFRLQYSQQCTQAQSSARDLDSVFISVISDTDITKKIRVPWCSLGSPYSDFLVPLSQELHSCKCRGMN